MNSEYSNREPIKLSKSLYTILCHIIPIGITLCFIEHLYYPQGPAEMFSNVFILMECYLKLGPDVDYSDVYLLRELLPTLIGIQKQKQKRKCWYRIQKLKRLVSKTMPS